MRKVIWGPIRSDDLKCNRDELAIEMKRPGVKVKEKDFSCADEADLCTCTFIVHRTEYYALADRRSPLISTLVVTLAPEQLVGASHPSRHPNYHRAETATGQPH